MEHHQLKFHHFWWLIVLVCHCEVTFGATRAPSWFYHRFYQHYQRHISDWWETNKEIQILQEYLRIPSVHPDPDYGPCVEFLQRQADSLNLPSTVHHPSLPEKPIVVITWQGSEPELPTILLNSHMDVVPVYAESWSHPPFGAEIDSQGRIYARGTQDTKGQGMAYLGAIRQLQSQGFQPKRTLHITYVPDEEIGGKHGMKAFVETQEFRDLNVGFALDESSPFDVENYFLFYAEKTMWRTILTATGQPGHAAILSENTAGEKFAAIIAKLMDRRQIEMEKVQEGIPLGNVTSINLTKVSGGVQTNVIPEKLTATFDIRLPPQEDLDEFEGQLRQWIEESGGGIELSFEEKDIKSPYVPIDNTNPQYAALQDLFTELNFDVRNEVLPMVSDSRYIRGKNIPAIGFIPMNKTPLLAHDHNEFIYASKYIEMIENFAKIIPKLTNES
ncbi:aminoacylase-1-like isoform X1 [Lutzomyia longipalpis]|uniref:aminoacylase-1-like isoform X1 n=1 Tax=Lutzomyia longipalpis TaxID=7200 RepID=UPI002483C578|nr:aminoacylase-1-like isoform X1 [Lutzomyia longipalpis]